MKQGRKLEVDVISAAQQCLEDPDYTVRQEAFILVMKLIPLVQELITNSDWKVRLQGLKLVSELVKRGQGIEVAIETVLTCLNHEDSQMREYAYSLALGLLSKGYGDKVLIPVLMANSDWAVRSQVVEMAARLVDRSEEIEIAREVAKKGLTDSDSRIQAEARALLQKLIDHGHGIQSAFRPPAS